MSNKACPVVLAIDRGTVWLYFEISGKWSMDKSAFPVGIEVGDRVDIKILPRDEVNPICHPNCSKECRSCDVRR